MRIVMPRFAINKSFVSRTMPRLFSSRLYRVTSPTKSASKSSVSSLTLWSNCSKMPCVLWSIRSRMLCRSSLVGAISLISVSWYNCEAASCDNSDKSSPTSLRLDRYVSELNDKFGYSLEMLRLSVLKSSSKKTRLLGCFPGPCSAIEDIDVAAKEPATAPLTPNRCVSSVKLRIPPKSPMSRKPEPLPIWNPSVSLSGRRPRLNRVSSAIISSRVRGASPSITSSLRPRALVPTGNVVTPRVPVRSSYWSTSRRRWKYFSARVRFSVSLPYGAKVARVLRIKSCIRARRCAAVPVIFLARRRPLPKIDAMRSGTGRKSRTKSPIGLSTTDSLIC